MADSINDNLPPPTRPGIGYLLGFLVVVGGVFAIMFFKSAVG